ncbi:MAG: hypothetical protein HZA83_00210 [Thaumarchaeota archaeon]|nr:hypothetical protein [Nitrososphaerota archaeon]
MIPSRIYLIIAFLVLGDVMTTHVNAIVFGERFGELGLIANFLMRMFGESWPFAMFPVEMTIFGIATFLFSRGSNALRIGTKRLSLAYFPALALSMLIGNNLLQILIFTNIF